MKDRVPGAPGQYKAVVQESEIHKMQAGQEFTITMVRDDQPIVEGTPYSKEMVLPDSLAKILCPDIADPTPADALRALLPKSGGNMVGPIDMGGHAITGVANSAKPSDAATVSYVQNAVFGFRGDYYEAIGDQDPATAYVSPGVYRITEDAPIAGIAHGLLVQFGWCSDTSAGAQLALPYYGGTISFRTCWYGTWYPWKTRTSN